MIILKVLQANAHCHQGGLVFTTVKLKTPMTKLTKETPFIGHPQDLDTCKLDHRC